MTTESAAADAEALAAWRASVAAVLTKSGRDSLPAEPETLLATTTYDDLSVAALYTRADLPAEAPLPGTAPYTRGRDAHRDVTVGWHVRTRHGLGGAQIDPAELNRHVLHDLENGATSLWLAVGGADLPVGGLARALDGVFLDLAPVVLDAGAETTAAAEALWGVIEQSGQWDEADVEAVLGADPLSLLIRSGTDTLGAAAELAVAAAGRPGRYRTLVVDGTVFADAGASDAQELGTCLAVGVSYLRAMTGAGLDLPAAFGQIEMRLAATDDQFATIAKFRAARQMWGRVADAAGCPEAGGAPQHAVTSAAMLAQRDPWVNLLRTTLAAFGAGVGGADAVTVLPLDAARPGGVPGVTDEFAARLARNTQLLLLEESHVGRVLDPAGGSFYVERRTADLAGAAWAWFQQIEAAGGLPHALDLVGDRIAATRARRDDDIAHRRTPLTGVSEFPDAGETPLAPSDREAPTAGPFAPIRYAAPYERLRDRSDAHLAAGGTRPQVFLATLGAVAEHNVRATFTANLLAAGGIDAIRPGALAADTIGAAFGDAGTPVAVVCGTDKRYAADGADAVEALRASGATTVLVAGSAKGFPDTDPPPDGFAGAGLDAPDLVGQLLDTLGVNP